MDTDAFVRAVEAIDWSEFRTAYGTAEQVPQQLKHLLSDDERTAMAASHELWCGLCHQRAYLSSAAEPSYPFLKDALAHSGPRLRDELLEIFLGFAECSSPGHPDANGEFQKRIRARLRDDRAFFEQLHATYEANAGDGSNGFAGLILAELARDE